MLRSTVVLGALVIGVGLVQFAPALLLVLIGIFNRPQLLLEAVNPGMRHGWTKLQIISVNDNKSSTCCTTAMGGN